MLRLLEQVVGVISGEYVLYDNGFGKQELRLGSVGREESKKRMVYFARIQPIFISVLTENNIPYSDWTVFGSVRDGLATPDSDIDVLVRPPPFNELGVWTNWMRKIEGTAHNRLRARLEAEYSTADLLYDVHLFAARPPGVFTLFEMD